MYTLCLVFLVLLSGWGMFLCTYLTWMGLGWHVEARRWELGSRDAFPLASRWFVARLVALWLLSIAGFTFGLYSLLWTPQ